MNSENDRFENQDLIRLFEVANQRLRHIHDALWKEETHYTWLIYILVAGAILALRDLPIVAIVLSVIGIVICDVGFFVVRRESKFFKRAKQSVDNYVARLNISDLEPPQEGEPGTSIQDYFRITLLIPIAVFIVLIVLSAEQLIWP